MYLHLYILIPYVTYLTLGLEDGRVVVDVLDEDGDGQVGGLLVPTPARQPEPAGQHRAVIRCQLVGTKIGLGRKSGSAGSRQGVPDQSGRILGMRQDIARLSGKVCQIFRYPTRKTRSVPTLILIGT